MARTPTNEQQACIDAVSQGIPLLKIVAVAGSGKTSTLEMTALANEKPSIYLAFNRVTATEGAARFPKHVTCQTTHSVAFKATGLPLKDKLSRPKGKYVNVAGSGSEIARYYDIATYESSAGAVLPSAFLGLLAKQTVANFECSSDPELTMNHVPMAVLKEKLAITPESVNNVRSMLFKVAKELWKDRINPRSPVLATHDTYLKLFQLSKPKLKGFDIIYVDEFQDTTPCVLDIVMNQKDNAQIVMVGDPRQAIYGWRGAVNAMEMVEAKTLTLSQSFRYGKDVAEVAGFVLESPDMVKGNPSIDSYAAYTGLVDRSQQYCRLFRTNAALLSNAVDSIINGEKVSFEIDIGGFVRMLQSAEALYYNKMKGVKHESIIPFDCWDALKVESQDDGELKRIANVVESKLAPQWISVLQSHVNPEVPDVIFTTAHKSKGREFEQVVLESDFKSPYNSEGEFTGLITEEQNLLYVAVTRAIHKLEYNDTTNEIIKYHMEGELAPHQKRVEELKCKSQ